MARVKQSITQRDWCFGEVREDFLERGDTNIHLRSAKKLRNMRILNSGAVQTRPGTICVAEAEGACKIHEATLPDGREYAVIPSDGGLTILNKDGDLNKTIEGLPWTAEQACGLWVKSVEGEVLLGSREVRPHVLNLEDCTVAPWQFATGADGRTAQPYYNSIPGVTIQPSSATGTVTVTASADAFKPSDVGEIIRYNGQELRVTGYTSPTQIQGEWLQEAPGTYLVELTVPAPPTTVPPTPPYPAVDQQFAKGDAVEGLTSGAKGVVTSVSSTSITILMNSVQDDFTVGEEVVGPSSVATPNAPKIATVTEVAPAPTANWDQQVFSDARGWPGSAECHQNRLIFTDIPSVPNAVIASQAGFMNDFTLGSKDGDAIFETIRGGRLLYTVSAEDLLVFGEDGVYYLGTRDGSPLTPLGFNPRRFSSIGSARVEPALVDDGVAYLSKCESRLMGATLAGDVNRYWQDIHLGEYAPHLIRKPTKLGTTTGDSDDPEQYLYAVNSDGTLAVLRWQKAPFEDCMGWALWDTKGEFIDATSVFCETHAIVERNGKRKIERFDDGICLDGTTVYARLKDVPDPKEGLSVYAECRALGTYGQDDIDAQCYPDEWGPFQVGCSFEQELVLWPRTIEETGRKGFVKQRNGRASVTTQHSTSYQYNGQLRPAYDGHDDLSAAPEKRTECHRFCNFGRTCHPCHEITKPDPGRLTVLSVSVEVQG